MQSGIRLGERYTLHDLLGTGGHGSVWTGHDDIIDRPVTVKVLSGELAGDESVRERFRHVALNVATLAIPGIVDVYDCLEEPDPDGGTLVCHITERVAGRTLREVLTDRGALPPPEALALITAVARSLHPAHRAGVVHGNLKPENLIVDADGAVTVVDFGFMPPRRSAYTAPELSAASPAADVYGLGAIVYECLTGRAPTADGDISPLLDDFDASDAAPIMKAMSPQAGHRFATAATFADACEHLNLVRREHPASAVAAAAPPPAEAEPAEAVEPVPETTDEPAAAQPEKPAEPEPTAEPDADTPPVPEPADSDAAKPATGGAVAEAAEDEGDAGKVAPSEDDGDTAEAASPGPAADEADTSEPAEPRLSMRTQALVVIVLIALISLVTTVVHLATPGEPTGAQPTREPEYNTSEPESPSASSVTGADRPPNSAEPAPTSSSPSPSDPPTSDDNDDGVQVPFVVGMRVETAQAELSGKGFLVVVSEEGEGRQQCRVHDQSPGGGEAVPSGSTVTISVRRVNNPQQCIDPT